MLKRIFNVIAICAAFTSAVASPALAKKDEIALAINMLAGVAKAQVVLDACDLNEAQTAALEARVKVVEELRAIPGYENMAALFDTAYVMYTADSEKQGATWCRDNMLNVIHNPPKL
ncbi:hypothetical protein [Neorhizobium galegae]|uniref:hypothetical protein n=1 Tax=Neorhizobium galegae TaxID=399 RepID=UPI000621C657|nr:hypothetical protein [Neorhizobium galegae]KAB1126313.1 hypothetical protein F4V90_04145 [Neorhizobium galegae]MCQ1805284.1 hypothetical protein [Neorhizobium galegae]CDZ56046.1 Hypothetical protein NGAL_HAMBI2566_05960 [Neorhizobium galegae bv. orientalis]